MNENFNGGNDLSNRVNRRQPSKNRPISAAPHLRKKSMNLKNEGRNLQREKLRHSYNKPKHEKTMSTTAAT